MPSSVEIAKRRGVGRYRRAGLRKRPVRSDPRAGGRTRSEAALGRSIRASGGRVSPSSLRVARPTADSGGRTASELRTAQALSSLGRVSPSSRVLAAPALPVAPKVGELKPPSKLPFGLELAPKEPSNMFEGALQTLMLATGGEALLAPKLSAGTQLAKTASQAERIADTASKASKASSEARAAREAAKAAERAGEKAGRVAKAGRTADRAERRAARARIRSDRSRMSRGDRAKDRAKSAKTRMQAAAYSRVHQGLAGGAGAAGLSAREIARQSPSKRAAATALAREGAKRAATAPRRLGAQSVRAGATPALLPVTGVVPSEPHAQNLVRLPFELGRATVESPGQVAKQSVKAAQDMVLGAPKAVEHMVTDPVGAGKMMLKDYKQRYGPLLSGNTDQFRRRVQTEGGLTPFALDALIAVPPVGKLAGSAARAGTLGKRAERFMTRDRPGVLVPVGEKVARRAPSRNMAGVAAQRTVDRVRGRITDRRAAQGRGSAIEAKQREAQVPVFEKHARARAVAGEKARSRSMLLAAHGRVLRLARNELFKLSKDQRSAIKFGLAFGIKSPEQARSILTKHIADIRAARDANTAYGKLDNIPEIEKIIRNANEIFTPEYRKSLDRFRAIEKRLVDGKPGGNISGMGTRRDPALNSVQARTRREAQQAELLIGKRDLTEPYESYRNRYLTVRDQMNLAEPGYFPSELSRKRGFAQSAIGGMKMTAQTKKYGGRLHREGIENLAPEVMIRGFQRNIKRNQQWHMVANTAERHSFPWSRGRNGQGSTRAQLVEHMVANGMDESTVTFFNPTLMRKQFDDLTEPGRAESGAGLGNPDVFGLGDAIQSAARRSGDGDFTEQTGWYAMPKEVIDELEASAKTTKIGRTADMLMSKTSGYLLAFNTGWFGFQTLSTAMQAAMRGVTPADWFLAQVYFHRLKQEGKATGSKSVFRRGVGDVSEIDGNPDLDRVNAWAGVSQAQDFQQVPHLGAAVTSGAVEGIRMFREGKWGSVIRSGNPVQGWFRLSQIPENANRRALAYKILKSDATSRMNGNITRIQKIMNRVTDHFKLDPENAMRAVIKDERALAHMAKELEAFLGDYQTFTATERMMLKRTIPFYSWMRFATTFAFYTLPRRHPMVTGLTYQLGRLETEDLRDLLGKGMSWALGKLFFGKVDEDSPFIDIYRGNPLLSSLVEFQDTKDLTGFIPPYVAVLVDQVAGKSVFTGRGFTVDGETVERKFMGRGMKNEFEILLNNYLKMFTPYRVAGEIAYEGTPQSDDAMPWAPEPKRYASGSGMETKRRGEKAYRDAGGAKGVLYRRMLPFLPQSSTQLMGQANYMNAEYAKELKRVRSGPSTSKPASTSSSAVSSPYSSILEKYGSGASISSSPSSSSTGDYADILKKYGN